MTRSIRLRPFEKSLLVFDPGCIESSHSPLPNDPVDNFTETAIVTNSSMVHPCDVIIAASGFAPLPLHFQVPVYGSCGKTLQALWSEMAGIEAYKSVVMADSPNFLYIFGPNAVTRHTRAVHEFGNEVVRMAWPILMAHFRT